MIDMNYEILDEQGNVINTIVADLDFVEKHYPSQFRERVETVAEPAPPPAPPSKEELLAQLQALQAQIQAIEETPS